MELKQVEKVALNSNGGNKQFYGMFNVAQDLGHQMTKEQLINIIKELDWAVTQNVDVDSYNTITQETIDQLEGIEAFD